MTSEGSEDEAGKALAGMKRVLDALRGLTPREQIDALVFTFVAVSGLATSEVLYVPNGFSEERARQVDHLRKLTMLIESMEPDLEMERLFQEGDFDAMAEHMRKITDDGTA